MTSVAAALAASVLWGTADFLAGRASRRHPAALVALVGQAAGLIVLAAVVAFHGVSSSALAPGAVSGAVGAVGVLVFYRALAVGTMSIVAPIAATSAIVPVIAGVADGERPGALQWVGVAAALTGVVLASTDAGGGEDGAARRGIGLALAAALTLGLALTFLGLAADHDALTGVTAARAVTVPVLAAVALRARARAAARDLPGLAAIGLLDTAANTAFALATTTGLLSLVAVLGGLFPVMTVILAYLLLGERLRGLQRAGVVLALAGVPLIGA